MPESISSVFIRLDVSMVRGKSLARGRLYENMSGPKTVSESTELSTGWLQMILRMRDRPNPSGFNRFQRVAHDRFNINHLETETLYKFQ
jgi:hypothetical protein